MEASANMKANNPNPTHIQMLCKTIRFSSSFLSSLIFSLPFRGFLFRQDTGRIGEIFPAPNVRNAALVTRDHYFFALLQLFSTLAAVRTRFAAAVLLKNDLACTIRTDADADPAQHPDHLVIHGIQTVVM